MSGSQSSQALPSYTCLILGFLKCLPFRMFLSLARRLILSLTCLVNEIEFRAVVLGIIFLVVVELDLFSSFVHSQRKQIRRSMERWQKTRWREVLLLGPRPNVYGCLGYWYSQVWYNGRLWSSRGTNTNNLPHSRGQCTVLWCFWRVVLWWIGDYLQFLSWRGDPRRARQWKALFQATTANVHT